jgi:hypothetical protein
VADFRFSKTDIASIEETIAYLDPASHELLSSLQASLSEADWEFAVTYIRQRVRSALEIEIMARALTDTAITRNLCDRRGAEHFQRSKTWLHNFGVIQTTDEYFAALSANHNNRPTLALEAMILIAQDMMFDRLDEEYERLLNPR